MKDKKVVERVIFDESKGKDQTYINEKEALNINDAKLAQIDSKQGKGPVKSYKKQGKAWFSSEPQIDDEGAMEDDEIVTYSDDY